MGYSIEAARVHVARMEIQAEEDRRIFDALDEINDFQCTRCREDCRTSSKRETCPECRVRVVMAT